MMRHKRKDKISKRKSILTLLFFSIIAFGILFIILYASNHKKEEIVINYDKLEFVTVQNPDPKKYITVINPIKAVDILLVAKHFYKHEEYWSYIYRDNILEDLLHIPAGTIVKIPRIDSIGEKNSLAKAKLLGDTLLEEHFSKKDD